MRTRRDHTSHAGPQWTRHKMLALLTATAVTALVLLAGVVLAVGYALHPTHTAAHRHDTAASAATGGSSASRGHTRPAGDDAGARDALANRPMPTVSQDAAHPGPVSTASAGPDILLPRSTVTGPAQVPSGFPHTEAGALAQLAAIDQTALQSASIATARAVITSWAQPGGPSSSSWSVVQGLAALLTEAGLSGGGSSQLALVLTPLMGQIKGSVGPDFVVPCIDFELDVTLAQTARGATADCQRMVWTPDAVGGPRWMIGPGAEPAPAPSVWPDTDTAIRVGYHDLRPGRPS